MLWVPNQDDPRFYILCGSQFFISVLLNLCSESVGASNFEIAEDSDTSSPSSITVKWNTHLLFNSDIVNFVGKIDQGEAESIVLLIFVLL